MIEKFSHPVPKSLMQNPELRGYFQAQQKTLGSLTTAQSPISDSTADDVSEKLNELLQALREYGVIGS
jgi:hypothetical protein